MTIHAQSKYPEVVAFAKNHPLPTKIDAMAAALLDLSCIFMACKKHESLSWSSMHLDIIHHAYAREYPGAFLSNPAFLPTTRADTHYGSQCISSHTAGSFFSYPHYQDDSLGPALLLGAFSPRTHQPSRPASFYAKSMLLMMERGDISQACARTGVEHIRLHDIANGAQLGTHTTVFFSIEFNAMQLSKLGSLRLNSSADCIDFSLTDHKPGLFSPNTRDELYKLSSARRSVQEAESIEQSCQAPTLKTRPASI
jgi:hypothetical protein